jgi:hypothetical protein
MMEPQARRMQKKPVQWPVPFTELFAAALSINIVANDGMPNGTQMHTNLMRTARLDSNLQQRETSKIFQYTILRVRRPPAGITGSHSDTYGRVPAYRQLDSPDLPWEPAMDQSDISFLDFPIVKSLTQARMSSVVLGYYEQTRRVLVQAVDDTRPRHASCRREILKVKKQPVRNSTGLRSGPRMDHHSCRLFDDSKLRIFKIDLERDLLRSECRRCDGLEIHFNGFSTSKAVTGFVVTALHTDGPGTIEQLNLRSSQVLQAL